ncbi:hypothetical protein H7R52_11935 [Weissella confusa]|uniref:Uncharacterized protein n=1 Tax=Weissella confusa TaxID=1583 RepID=A0A923NJB3_WEICO|nr:hypothetical protein [Weissella confusa]
MAKQSFQKPKGTADLLPGESLKWHYVGFNVLHGGTIDLDAIYFLLDNKSHR